MPVISASFESFAFLSVFKLINFTCSSSNSVDLIKSFIFIFIELKVKGVVCGLLFFCVFFFWGVESKVGKKFRLTKIVHAESAMVDRTLRLKTNHIVSHFFQVHHYLLQVKMIFAKDP